MIITAAALYVSVISASAHIECSDRNPIWQVCKAEPGAGHGSVPIPQGPPNPPGPPSDPGDSDGGGPGNGHGHGHDGHGNGHEKK